MLTVVLSLIEPAMAVAPSQMPLPAHARRCHAAHGDRRRRRARRALCMLMVFTLVFNLSAPAIALAPPSPTPLSDTRARGALDAHPTLILGSPRCHTEGAPAPTRARACSPPMCTVVTLVFAISASAIAVAPASPMPLPASPITRGHKTSARARPRRPAPVRVRALLMLIVVSSHRRVRSSASSRGERATGAQQQAIVR